MLITAGINEIPRLIQRDVTDIFLLWRWNRTDVSYLSGYCYVGEKAKLDVLDNTLFWCMIWQENCKILLAGELWGIGHR